MAEPLGNLLGVHAELVSDGHGGGGVQHVVAAGNIQLKWTERTESRVNQKLREAPLALRKQLQTIVGLGCNAIRKNAAMSAGQNRGQQRIVDAGGTAP